MKYALKIKPKTKTLIELERGGETWRIVERTCTRRGLSGGAALVVADTLPSYPAARKVFNEVKGVGL